MRARGQDRALVLRPDARQHRDHRRAGIKTRRFDDILGELEQAFEIHAAGRARYLGGVHFELTGDNVTECIGGARGLTEADLRPATELRDPRLNYEQALEMAMLIAQRMTASRGA